MQSLKLLPSLRLLSLIFCFNATSAFSLEGVTTMSISLKSSAFDHQSEIPSQYTCDGPDVSPALSWSNVPKNAKSLVLIVDDPDAPDPAAPKLTWVHWVLYNIPPTITGFPEHVASNELPSGTLEGKNDWNQIGYKGPCPPIGRHRYFFKLYALDATLPDLNSPNKAQLEQAMARHIINHAELIGTYQH
jgi:Raf kinase inhibitor-like YbhB/YbcL family protein